MANTKQARKRIRQNEKRRLRNASAKSMLRTFIKKVRQALEMKNYPNAMQAFRVAVSVIDRVARKGIIHKNKAARIKSRLNARIKELLLLTERK